MKLSTPTYFQVTFLLLILFSLPVLPAHDQRVALLPMTDFSRGVNGLNLPFTQVVEDSLRRLGLEIAQGRVAAEEQVAGSGVRRASADCFENRIVLGAVPGET